jgi:lysophospholipase L1-like esterase
MEARGLFAESQYPPYLPTFDGLHPTHGGYGALGAMWLDGIRRLP